MGSMEVLRHAYRSEPITMCHGDVNAGNVLVDPTIGQFLAFIGWAGAGWLDPAWDFAGVSLNAVPPLLVGHRFIEPLPGDHYAEARICWVQVQIRLFSARSHVDTSKSRFKRDIQEIRRFALAAGLVASV
jgi:thiamine kinase-like enzyme